MKFFLEEPNFQGINVKENIVSKLTLFGDFTITDVCNSYAKMAREQKSSECPSSLCPQQLKKRKTCLVEFLTIVAVLSVHHAVGEITCGRTFLFQSTCFAASRTHLFIWIHQLCNTTYNQQCP